jgi:hypothetical protein
MTVLPSPVALWDEPPRGVAALGLSRLTPYKTAAGYWVFLSPRVLPPPGATQGAMVHGASYNTLTTSTTVGVRMTRNAGATVFFY